MKIYTKTGDKGTTSLVSGTRIGKDCQRLEAYGSIDELNAVIGVAMEEIRTLKLLDNTDIQNNMVVRLQWIQCCLFSVGGILATEDEKMAEYWSVESVNEWTKMLEQYIDEYESGLAELKKFVLPSGSKSCALLHWARTVCRRAEREICRFLSEADTESIFFASILQFVNRLSDFLFIASRKELQLENISEKYWESMK